MSKQWINLALAFVQSNLTENQSCHKINHATEIQSNEPASSLQDKCRRVKALMHTVFWLASFHLSASVQNSAGMGKPNG
jgi:hypothetical protein